MLINALLHSRKCHPKTVAVEDSRATLSYRQLTRLALVFRSVVLRETDSDRIGIMLPASSVFPPVLMGTLWARKLAVPLNFLLAPEAIARIVQDAGLDFVITVRPFAELIDQLPVRPVFLEELSLKRSLVMRALLPTPPPPDVHPDDTAVLLYTSGTTAEPKGAELTYNNLHSNCVDAITAMNLTPPQVMLNILPPFHVFGLTANVLVPIVLGASVVAIPRFNPAAVIRAVSHKKVTIMLAIPSMYAALLRIKHATADTFRSVSLAISGGEPLPDTLRTAFKERFGVTLREGYGLTETSPVLAVSSLKHHREGAVGRPIPNVEVQLRDDNGCEVPRGRDGEIFVRGPGVMKGYYRKPAETRAVLDKDGWFATGDIGRLDEDGFLSITGRAKEMLIIGGENVFPREIEAVLEAHEGVSQAAVIGVPDASRGEAPVAFVIPQPGVALEELALRTHVKKSLAGFKVPKRVYLREDLPLGPTGKILKRKLHELL